MFGMFVNILTTDDKYSVRNRENLSEPIQMLLYQKQNRFSQFCGAFLKFTSNFDHFEKKR